MRWHKLFRSWFTHQTSGSSLSLAERYAETSLEPNANRHNKMKKYNVSQTCARNGMASCQWCEWLLRLIVAVATCHDCNLYMRTCETNRYRWQRATMCLTLPIPSVDTTFYESLIKIRITSTASRALWQRSQHIIWCLRTSMKCNTFSWWLRVCRKSICGSERTCSVLNANWKISGIFFAFHFDFDESKPCFCSNKFI